METWNKQAHIEIWNTCRPDLCYELEPNVFKAWPWPCVLFLPFHRTSGAQWWDPILSFGQGRHHQRYTHTDCHLFMLFDTFFSSRLPLVFCAAHWFILYFTVWQPHSLYLFCSQCDCDGTFVLLKHCISVANVVFTVEQQSGVNAVTASSKRPELETVSVMLQ